MAPTNTCWPGLNLAKPGTSKNSRCPMVLGWNDASSNSAIVLCEANILLSILWNKKFIEKSSKKINK